MREAEDRTKLLCNWKGLGFSSALRKCDDDNERPYLIVAVLTQIERNRNGKDEPTVIWEGFNKFEKD